VSGGAQESGPAAGEPRTDAAAPGAAATRFRNYAELAGHGRRGLREDALAIAAEALAAVDPAAALTHAVHLDGDRLVVADPRGGESQAFDLSGRRVFVVGAGKATIGMARVLDELLGARIAGGAVVVKHGQAVPLRYIEVLEAAHPVPDEGSLRGGLRLLEVAAEAQPDDLLLSLITGGSSALAVVPAKGISLVDKAETNRVLLASGADIVAINDVRKHISRIKGGRLARAAGCEIVNFTISDVVGDPLDYFCDLTVRDRSTFAGAREACDRFDLWERLPVAVADHLRRADPAQETCHRLDRVTSFVLADARMMCEAAARAASARGYRAQVLRLDLEGESADAGRWFAAQVAAAAPGTALVAGGEATTTLSAGADLRAAGGPSQEGALAGALELGHSAAARRACLLCLDSDGSDGPTDAAGALVDDMTAAALAEAGVDAVAALAAHTAGAALTKSGDLMLTGPTGTNVNDLKIGLVKV
jgi:glycerate 2-kinase